MDPGKNQTSISKRSASSNPPTQSKKSRQQQQQPQQQQQQPQQQLQQQQPEQQPQQQLQPQQQTETVPTIFTKSDEVRVRLYIIHHNVIRSVLHYFYRKSFINIKKNESLSAYFLRNKVNPLSVDKFKKSLFDKQRNLIHKYPNGDHFDVRLLCRILLFWIRTPHGRNYQKSKDFFQKVQEKINSLYHSMYSYEQSHLEKEKNEIEDLLHGILNECKTLYNLQDEDTQKEIDEVTDKINRYSVDPLIPDAISKYKKAREKIRSGIVEKGQKEAIGQFKGKRTISPQNHIVDIEPIPVEEVYIEMEMDSEKSFQSKSIYYQDILEEEGTDIVVINGHAGSGKTTLVKMIISDWSEKTSNMKHLSEYGLILTAECRSRHIDSVKKLISNTMPKTYEEFGPEVTQETVLSQKVLAILDGLDELNSTSAQLFMQLLELKNDNKLSLMITTRPEKINFLKYKLKSYSLQMKHIRIIGVPTQMVNSFVMKYWNAVPKGPDAPDVHYLLMYLKKTIHKLADLWRLPYNLTLLTILYIFRKESIGSINTASRLYKEIMSLYTEKLQERLRLKDQTCDLYEAERKSLIKQFLYILAKESLTALREDHISLPEDAFQRLDDICQGHKVQTGEMMGAYLQRNQGEEEIYEYPHKDLQDYLGASYIWKELTEQSASYESHKFSELFLKWTRQQQDLPEALIDQMEKCITGYRQSSSSAADSARSLQTSDSYPEGSSTVRKILESNSISTTSDMSKYQNLMKHILGLTFLEDDEVKYEVKEELVYLLEKTGVSDNHDWIAVLNDVQVDKDVASIISKRQNLLTGKIKIDDSSLTAYTALLQVREEPIEDSDMIISLFIKEENENNLKLMALIANLQLTLQELEVNHNNYKQVAKHLKESTGSTINPQKVKLVLTEKTTSKTIEEMFEVSTSFDEVVMQMDMEFLYKHPDQTDQTIMDAIDSTLLRCHHTIDNYAGPVTDAVVRRLLPRLTQLAISVNTLQELSTLLAAVDEGKHSLNYLWVCIAADVYTGGPSQVPPLNGVKGGIHFFLPDVRQDTAVAACNIARMLMPVGGFDWISFPRLHCKTGEVIQEMEGVRIRYTLSFPSVNKPEDAEEEREIREAASKKTGCNNILWGGYGSGFYNIDSW